MDSKKEVLKDIETEASCAVRPSSEPFSQYVDGFRIPGFFSADMFRSALKYKPRLGDIFITTYPRCGSTWTRYIVLLVLNQGEPMISLPQFLLGSPYLDKRGAALTEELPRPLAIKTHLPHHLAPRSDVAKYIYITRNPKDCCVSYFHFLRNAPEHGFTGSFNELFELFINGNIDYGDYFDHVLGWYEHRSDANVLFLTYEEMKENLAVSVLKIATFIDEKLYAEPLRNDPQKLETIVKGSTFENMKRTFRQQIDSFFSMPKEIILNSELPSEMKKMFAELPQMSAASETPQAINFIRKGIIGDWRNYFSAEQNKRLQEKFEKRMKDTDLVNLWQNYM